MSAVAAESSQWIERAMAQGGRDPLHLYARVLLVNGQGAPLRARSLVPRRNYIFNYPFAATPCFLLDLGKPLAAVDDLALDGGSRYAWAGGVGANRSIVAFSAICAHKLAYPTRDVSFIRFQPEKSARSEAERIHCCADHSVYDPARGARVVNGPAKQPLAAIALDYDRDADLLHAIGVSGGELFEAFFAKYDFRLAMEYGSGKARKPVSDRSVVREMGAYCRQTIAC
jgi:arsenite oxidase small subunit